ncbi:hypothetical protein UFOVP615_10 [uncultured Caudovirales phage]|uniref:Uncharacterized protein n=1 Tax=uncultured Caudovirales phage TaxID=2100421 RepID=A0A6J5N9W0_9CAUD|nr:hypothetical protein UFOVP615_10 [uncultured Caudovirales phage]
MTYNNKQEIFEQAKLLMEKHKFVFMEHLIAFLPISKQTFYHYFPVGSDEMDAIKKLMEKEKTIVKRNILVKWKASDDVKAQKYLYMLTGSREERQRLSGLPTDEDLKEQGEKQEKTEEQTMFIQLGKDTALEI